MTKDPEHTTAPDEAAPERATHERQPPETSSEEAVGRSGSVNRGDSGEGEEQVRDVDPHPDTPDDFDDDASSPRESVEAVHDAGGDARDD